jgi:hypothetical protein
MGQRVPPLHLGKSKPPPSPWFPVTSGGESGGGTDGKLKLPTVGAARGATHDDPAVSRNTMRRLETKTALADEASHGTLGTNNAVWHWTDRAAGGVSATVAGLQEQAAAAERRRRRWDEREQRRGQSTSSRDSRSLRGANASAAGARGGSRGGAGGSRGGVHFDARSSRRNNWNGGGRPTGGCGKDSEFAAYSRADSDAPARVATLGGFLAEKMAKEKKTKMYYQIGVRTKPRLLGGAVQVECSC